MNIKENITDYQTDISNLQNQIKSLNLGSSFEGYYYHIYYYATHLEIQLNYNKCKLIYWFYNAIGWFKEAFNDIGEDYINTSIKELTLPGNVKLINSDKL